MSRIHQIDESVGNDDRDKRHIRPLGSHAGIPVVELAGYLRQVQSASSQQR